MRTMTLADAKAGLSAAVDLVEAGEEIVITRRGRPVARLVREIKAPEGNVAAQVNDLRAFVMAQPAQAESSVAMVRRLRQSGRY